MSRFAENMQSVLTSSGPGRSQRQLYHGRADLYCTGGTGIGIGGTGTDFGGTGTEVGAS
jgi:hypothetical protein